MGGESRADLKTVGSVAVPRRDAGVVLGMLGAGCASCGSAVLLGLLSLLSVSTSLLFLPLDGLEFALGVLVVLTLSIYWLADGMPGGEINGCPVDV
ncbi:hypothetical protein C472_14077 [Halorubrum tebenquichense DSM 14210]|uniref:Uncharacterized protein n=1 Tax=Halorubrum tebenquichense DSM 14210 TaxID=1227485 RepID=M0DG03_9EURY|nr:hypothetical protein [Halorubrum tebenquichense]ELZ33738.1 hypothetical protein C472_14077 [Halorubrum tebenquichense DSM 14210]